MNATADLVERMDPDGGLLVPASQVNASPSFTQTSGRVFP